MTNDWRQVGFFAAGLAIGAVATVTIVLGPDAPGARDRSPGQHGASAAASAAVAFSGTECPLEPAIAIAGAQDGRYRMPAELSGYAATDPRVFVVMGQEAAAAGRPHDAEIAYLMACRVANRFQGAASLASADARYELARHYGNLANAADPGAPNCGEMLRRAEAMYSDSLQLYRARHGADHEKSRRAAQALTGVRQTLMAQAGIPPVIPPSATATAAPQEAEPVRSESAASPPAAAQPKRQARALQVEKARERSPQQKVAARQVRPAAACAAARTTAEKLICSDAELARLDREVGYLRARARNARIYEDEWRRREALCRDRACVLQLIATKRSQLMADINST